MRSRIVTASSTGFVGFTAGFSSASSAASFVTRMPRSNQRKRIVSGPAIDDVIHTLRGERVILDADLARIYGVATKVFNQAVKRNREKFPPDFILQLTVQELPAL